MKSHFSCCTFVLILFSSYAICTCNKLALKNVNLPKEHNKLIGANIGQQYTPEQQISTHTTALTGASNLKDEPRQKRSERDFSSNEYRDFNEIIDDLEDNSIAAAVQPQELDFENMPPLTYYLLLQKLKQLQSNEPTYRVRTPRLGRSIDMRHLETTFGRGIDSIGEDGVSEGANSFRQQKQLVSRLIKKSVPFKPRLGKRTQHAMLCD